MTGAGRYGGFCGPRPGARRGALRTACVCGGTFAGFVLLVCCFVLAHALGCGHLEMSFGHAQLLG